MYLSYLVPASRLRSFVPEILPLSTFFDDMAFISVVVFRSKNLRFANIPIIAVSYNQINVRTYVKDPISGNDGVFFISSGITSGFTAFFTSLLKIPWHHISLSISAGKHIQGSHEKYKVSGSWNGDIYIEAYRVSPVEDDIHYTENYERATRFLTGPEIGFFAQKGNVLRFRVKHTAIIPHEGEATKISFPLITSSGLIKKEELERPYNIILSPKAYFQIFMPPHMVSLKYT